ncbi:MULTISPECIES: lysine--tRNA ligase [Petrotoga]|uniref:Lysine--tRNA ligase n=2 Tax=Petrotoga sibirica TaxID=156202 RepID=A0A4R8ET65_9BACT|nr:MULTISPECIES: lysine--tRNA ligase [Petrotoga]POZ89370.1 lysyl-tRNA synthetase [Petrotoga sibirica DSM 13575]POZ91731.1 lysyl-tRNA synthetase [Petrotoga sp. SL27]TDX15486.1 lysyl-tRNA synthetase class II [Petrotoga sibirica]
MDLRNIRIHQIKEMREKGYNPYKYNFQKNYTSQQIKELFDSKIEAGQQLPDQVFNFAGRLMNLRKHGKSAFTDLKDEFGRIQIYIRLDLVGQESYDFFKEYIDIGDWVGIKGYPFKTRTGELTLLALEIKLLSKALRPLPEKWHGLKDKEVRYRQRYVDMIANDDTIKTLRTRFLVIKYIREYLNDKGFLEVETPVLQSIMGGANARPFITHLNVYDIDMYLRIATELHLKRLVVGGMEKVYEIGKIFRNEGVSNKHNPEFTTIELYQAFADYNNMMELTEDLLYNIAKKVHNKAKVIYQGEEIDFTPPFKRIKMREFIQENLGIDIVEASDQELKDFLKDKGEEVEIEDRYHYLDKVWDLVEDKIVQPTFVMDYPIELSPLAKRKKDDPRLTERFELIIKGNEIANAFSELNDPQDQFERFKKQMELKELGDEEAQMMDLDFIRALEYGLPPTGGLGIGIDRVCMLLTDTPTIRDIIPFPIVKPVSFEDEEAMLKEEETNE